MSQGLQKEEAENSDNEYKSINPPVKNKKKDLKQRRKQREHSKLLSAIQMAKKAKKKITDIHNLRNMMQEIKKQTDKAEILKSKRLKKKEYTQLEPKRLARRKFESEEIEFNAPRDISGNLRTVKKEGSILLDRFKSFERRNILRPSSKSNSKKGKFKKFTKSDHKDDWKTTVARPSLS
ncbi:ribosome biogenesis protein NOP53-like [Photinus pyralis]|nr:ribosome biogenesis protein NOP53-like [Photinus pyralis]